jgi:hypothetical protein
VRRKKKNPALDKKALWKDIAREERKAQRTKLRELRSNVRTLREARIAARKDAIAGCKAAREAARAQASAACLRGVDVYLKAREHFQAARAAFESERANRRELRAIDRSTASRKAERRAYGAPAKVRAQESDDEVRANIPPELHKLFSKVRRSIKGSPRRSRTEEFLEYVEEHPSEVYDEDDPYERAAAQMEERAMRSNPRRKRRNKNAPAPPLPDAVKVVWTGRRALDGKRTRVILRSDGLYYAEREDVPPSAPSSHDGFLWEIASRTRTKAIEFAGGPRLVRRRNPKPSKKPWSAKHARRRYVRDHWGDRGKGRMRTTTAPDPRPGPGASLISGRTSSAPNPRFGAMTEMGELVELVTSEARYSFPKGSRPTLAYHSGGLILAGGRVRLPKLRGEERRVVASGALLDLGELRSIAYATKKGRTPRGEFEHRFEETRPHLARAKTGLVVVGGSYRVTERGIVG